MTTEPSNEVPDADARPTDMDQEVAETGTRPDLVWTMKCLAFASASTVLRQAASISTTTSPQ
jgi:hypothetical protein